ncbi:MAG TPA: hypothetical protein VK437_04115 [Steroidobacteraceae bacterium]|nr:hypothetical protein [Steroidobacteraceae bacterium]
MKQVYQALALVLLLLTQQGAVVHEIGHLSTIHAAELRLDTGEASEGSCALCPAFAQVATPAFSHSFLVPSLARTQPARAAELSLGVLSSAVLTPRSRGPPSRS